jgi:hypothetical protein
MDSPTETSAWVCGISCRLRKQPPSNNKVALAQEPVEGNLADIGPSDLRVVIDKEETAVNLRICSIFIQV